MTCPPNCKGPGSDCLGHCLHRMPIDFAGPEPEDKPESLWSRVWSAYKAHRQHGRMDGIRHAFAAWHN